MDLKLQLLTELKAQVKEQLPYIKRCELWNNQIQHTNQSNDGNTVSYPALFIEFYKPRYKTMGQGVQEFEMEVRTHLGYRTHNFNDEQILQLQNDVHFVIQRFQSQNFSNLERLEEELNTDHDHVQDFITTYTTRGTDYTSDIRPTQEFLIGLDLNIVFTGITS